MSTRLAQCEPHFLAGKQGKLFALYFPARMPARGALLYLPPFAEEMNRCRTAAAAQARRLAAAGHACLLLDHYGTGDSEGDFADARWAIWCEDALSAARWLEERTALRPTLWGLRLGALLAMDVASRSECRLDRLLLWQPVTDGKTHLTQHLRLRVAGLMDRGLPAETSEGMRTRLALGECVEIAGYDLPGPLAQEIDRLRITGPELAPGTTIDWLENVAAPDKALPVGAQRAIDALLAKGLTVHPHTFAGPPVWSLHERDDPSQLIDATMALFER